MKSNRITNRRYINLTGEELITIQNKAKNYTMYDVYEWYVCKSTGEMILMSEFVRLYNKYNNSVKMIKQEKYDILVLNDKKLESFINRKRVEFKYSNEIDIYEFNELCFERAYKDYFLEKSNTDNLIKLMYYE